MTSEESTTREIEFKDIDSSRFYIDRDLRRNTLLFFPELLLKDRGGSSNLYRIKRLVVEELKIDPLLPSGIIDCLPVSVGYAHEMVRVLGSMGIRSESDTEKDRRIKDLQKHNNFLEAVVYSKLGVSPEQLRELRKIRE